ncbi:MAG: CoA-binding protein [Candidatus Methanoperedens sp.]|nr:CoA-binding protein [Candidatus Methanoperedens nitroreducens]MDJ1423689.1 CoA-binding protein [Candidatus Methanoperedens sp.]
MDVMLSSIFEPESIAVIGASSNEMKWGGRILKNILSGFRGPVYPVNPKEANIQGLTTYSSILDIPYDVEMAVVTVPASSVLPVVEECGEKGVKGLVMISAGFSETGSAGAELEKKLVSIVRKYGMRMIGPNTLGIINKSVDLNASIIGRLPSPGSISFITQSGTLGLALADWTIDMGLGLCKVISIGNKADIDDTDLIEYLNNDPSTGVIAMYVEGLKRGRDFIQAARRIKKPVIVLKTGRSKKGARAVFSHTGSIAGSDEIYSAAFRQAGVLRVDTIEEVFDAALAFSCQPLPRRNNVAILSNGGGASIVASDECERQGINIVDFTEETRKKIKDILPEYASSSNPIDTAGTVSYKLYREMINALLIDQNVDALIVIYVHSPMTNARPPADAVLEMKQRNHKPIIACWMGGAGTEEGINILKSGCLPNYSVPERAVRALAALIKHREFLERVKIGDDVPAQRCA